MSAVTDHPAGINDTSTAVNTSRTHSVDRWLIAKLEHGKYKKSLEQLVPGSKDMLQK